MRTVAMTVVAAGCAAMAAGWLYFLIALLPTADKETAAVLVPLSITFASIFGVLGALAGLWHGARTRAWFWLVAAVVSLVAVLLNAPYLPFALAHPADTNSFLISLNVVVAGTAITAGGIAAFLDVRRGRQTWSPGGRTGLVVIGVVAAVLGTTATSILAGSAAGGGSRMAAAPTMTGVITAEKTKFVVPSLSVKNGDVVGLFVVNRDATGHTFDIDKLGIHVQLAPNSTTAVAVAPTGAGSLEYYCAVPGHRDAGMVGTIAVQ